jgi:hypothetical protein
MERKRINSGTPRSAGQDGCSRVLSIEFVNGSVSDR